MRLRDGAAALGLIACVAAAACSNPFTRQYEYDEQTYLAVDGSATVVLSASVPALVALRGLDFDPSPQARLTSDDVRRVLEAAGCRVQRVSRPWRRDGRRFVQARFTIDDVRMAGTCAALRWSTYSLTRRDGAIHFEQVVGPPASKDSGPVNWSGSELVTFKLHLPSRVTHHNVRRLEDDTPGALERGNILTWEQRLADRRAGTPITMTVTMDEQSILYRTLWLFAGAFAAAVIVLVGLIWLTIRRGRQRASPPPLGANRMS